jgi:hypothetical protein
MRVVHVTKDTAMFVPGYEHRIWQCSGCSTIERRLTFSREPSPTQSVPVETIPTVPLSPPEPPAFVAKTNAWAKAVDQKLRDFKERAMTEAVAELERAARFNRDWDNKFRPTPPPSE